MKINVRTLLLATTAIGLMISGPAFAADSTEDAIKSLQKQVESLQKQLTDLKAKEKETAKAQAETAAVVAASQPRATPDGVQKEVLPGVKVTLGGFVETDAIWRSKNQTADLGSSFNGSIPFDNSVNAHQSEFRGSARASRLTLLTEGNVDKDYKLSAYFASDFLGAAPTANSIETNSYTPRLREAYATVDRDDLGLHFLGGQTWSLATMNKVGITPRKENLPLVIDGSLLPGYNYTRTPQIRLVKDFDKKFWAGLSLESPQVNFGGVVAPTTVNAYNGGGAFYASTTNYSTDMAPDIVAKLAYDPGFGHYEVFGVARFFRDNVLADFHQNYEVGGGGGASVQIPVIQKVLDVQASFMAGQGIGRYGPVLLPDFAFAPNGDIKPLTQYTALFGLIAHPDPTWDLYVYLGGEKVSRQSEDGTHTVGTSNYNYGYGSNSATSLSNAGCYTTGGACPAQTSSVWQVTPGLWKQLYKGDYGTMKVGAQYSLTRRNAFSDFNGNAPHSYESMAFTAFRYAPF